MRAFHLNLASKPFRDYRPIWLVAAALAIVSVLMLIDNARTAYRYFANTEAKRAEIDRLQKQTDDEERQAKSIQEQLRGFNRKSLNMQTQFINGQIAERAFSWSKLLDQLERVVPKDVRLTSLNPTVNADGSTRLLLNCVAKSSDGLVDLIQRMQADPHFVSPFPQQQNIMDTGLHQFSIETGYRPEPRGVLP